MATTNQVKITLSDRMMEYAESLSQQYGTTVAGMFKFLLLKKAEEVEYPIFQISERSQQKLHEALGRYDEAISVNSKEDLDKLFKNLIK